MSISQKTKKRTGREIKRNAEPFCKSLLYLLPSAVGTLLLPSADGAPPQAPLATSSQTRPRFHLGSIGAFDERLFKRDFETGR